jgi:hypothetical protein
MFFNKFEGSVRQAFRYPTLLKISSPFNIFIGGKFRFDDFAASRETESYHKSDE